MLCGDVAPYIDRQKRCFLAWHFLISVLVVWRSLCLLYTCLLYTSDAADE